MKSVKVRTIMLLTLLLILMTMMKLEPVVGQTGNPPDEDILRETVLRQPFADNAVLTELEVEGNWARGAFVQVQDGKMVTGEGVIFVAYWNGTTWDFFFEGNPSFRRLLPKVPDSLLPSYLKADLDYESVNENAPLVPSVPQGTGYKLPWPAGISYRISRAWATGSCNHAGSHAVDIAMPVGSRIVAARSGIVHSVSDSNNGCGCDSSVPGNSIVIRHDPNDGLYDYYVHIGKNKAAVSVGQSVSQGQTIAYSDQIGWTCGSGSCPPGTCYVPNCTPGPHLHFHVQNAAGQRQYITFDDVGAIVGCQSYTSGNGGGDTTPPTINFISYPPLNQWYNINQRIDWTVSDASGVWGFSQAWDNAPSGPPPQFPGATNGWLDFTGLGQGPHTVRVRAWDNSSNHNEASAQLGWFGYDTLPPSNPTSISPGCDAQNNIWQNVCNDLNFTWSGASDGNGSGVKDYHYYWGENASGAPDTFTAANGFDPPSVSGPVAVRYLRMSTRDNLNQESPPSPVFVLRYDASAPTVTLQINNGAATASQVNVLLNLSAGDTGSGVYQMRASNTSAAWPEWQPYADTIPWALPALDRRTHTVYVQVRDRASNVATASASIYLDLYPPMPHSTSYRICADVVNAGGSVGITSTGYSLVSSIGQPWATGANNNTSASFAGRAGFLSSITGCLPITREVTTVYTVTQWVVASAGNLRGSANYRLGDTAGQPAASGGSAFTSASYKLSSGFWAGITVTVPPTSTPPVTPIPITPTPSPTPGSTPTPQPGGFGVSINDGRLYTNNPVVTVRLWAPNVTHMRLSNDGGYSNEGWQTYRVTTTWVISTYGSYVMPRYVYAWFRDGWSNVYGPYFDDIVYDPTAPQGSVSILGGETSTVTLWLEAWDDNSGVGEMRVGSTRMITATWQPYTNTVQWVLSSDVVYAQFRDRAGNESYIYGSDGSVYNPNAKHRIFLPVVLRQF